MAEQLMVSVFGMSWIARASFIYFLFHIYAGPTGPSPTTKSVSSYDREQILRILSPFGLPIPRTDVIDDWISVLNLCPLMVEAGSLTQREADIVTGYSIAGLKEYFPDYKIPKDLEISAPIEELTIQHSATAATMPQGSDLALLETLIIKKPAEDVEGWIKLNEIAFSDLAKQTVSEQQLNDLKAWTSKGLDDLLNEKTRKEQKIYTPVVAKSSSQTSSQSTAQSAYKTISHHGEGDQPGRTHSAMYWKIRPSAEYDKSEIAALLKKIGKDPDIEYDEMGFKEIWWDATKALNKSLTRIESTTLKNWAHSSEKEMREIREQLKFEKETALQEAQKKTADIFNTPGLATGAKNIPLQAAGIYKEPKKEAGKFKDLFGFMKKHKPGEKHKQEHDASKNK